MKLIGENTDIKVLRKNDKQFIISTGIYKCPRAGFEISNDTPQSWREIIMQSLEREYIKPVAYVKSSELMMEILCD